MPGQQHVTGAGSWALRALPRSVQWGNRRDPGKTISTLIARCHSEFEIFLY